MLLKIRPVAFATGLFVDLVKNQAHLFLFFPNNLQPCWLLWLAMKLDAVALDRVIEMAWEDRTPLKPFFTNIS